MKQRMGLTGEASDHKIAGIFTDLAGLQVGRDRLVDSVRLDDDQLIVLAPGERADGELLEPESRGIWHTLIRAHVWLGLAGAIIGALVFLLLVWLDVAFVVGNPWTSFVVLVAFSTFGGGLLGGAVTLRPDHAPYIHKVKSALRQGRHVLVVHATDRRQMNLIRQILKDSDADTVATL
ncbi:MAG: hypothetical protein ACNA7J_03880 [Wenzhouxiangella sp.]